MHMQWMYLCIYYIKKKKKWQYTKTVMKYNIISVGRSAQEGEVLLFRNTVEMKILLYQLKCCLQRKVLQFLCCVCMWRQQLQELRLKQEQKERDQKGSRRKDLQGESAGERVKLRRTKAKPSTPDTNTNSDGNSNSNCNSNSDYHSNSNPDSNPLPVRQ